MLNQRTSFTRVPLGDGTSSANNRTHTSSIASKSSRWLSRGFHAQLDLVRKLERASSCSLTVDDDDRTDDGGATTGSAASFPYGAGGGGLGVTFADERAGTHMAHTSGFARRLRVARPFDAGRSRASHGARYYLGCEHVLDAHHARALCEPERALLDAMAGTLLRCFARFKYRALGAAFRRWRRWSDKRWAYTLRRARARAAERRNRARRSQLLREHWYRVFMLNVVRAWRARAVELARARRYRKLKKWVVWHWRRHRAGQGFARWRRQTERLRAQARTRGLAVRRALVRLRGRRAWRAWERHDMHVRLRAYLKWRDKWMVPILYRWRKWAREARGARRALHVLARRWRRLARQERESRARAAAFAVTLRYAKLARHFVHWAAVGNRRRYFGGKAVRRCVRKAARRAKREAVRVWRERTAGTSAGAGESLRTIRTRHSMTCEGECPPFCTFAADREAARTRALAAAHPNLYGPAGTDTRVSAHFDHGFQEGLGGRAGRKKGGRRRERARARHAWL